jgi:hypothetical protein
MKKRAGSEFSRRFGSFVVLIFAVTVLAGCGGQEVSRGPEPSRGPELARNQVSLTVRTEPKGAMLYSSDAALGMAPQTLVYTADSQAQEAGWFRTADVTAIWPSGARAQTSVTLVLHQGPQVVTISRPPDAPGLDVDMAHALKLQQAKTVQDKADAQAGR